MTASTHDRRATAGGRLRLGAGVDVLPMCGDDDLDCRMLFLGDNQRLLLRAYAEAIRTLSRPRSIAARARFLRGSAEVTQFYEVTTRGDTISLRMHDSVFAEPASHADLDLVLTAGRGTERVTEPLPLERLSAVGALLPLLNGDHDRSRVETRLRESLDDEGASWASTLLDRWSAAGWIDETDALENRLPAADGSSVTFMGHTSLLVRTETTTILTDPLFRPSLGIPDTAFDATRLPIDAICCTHSHWDHCDLATLLRFDKRTPVFVPRVGRPTAFNPAMVPALRLLGFCDIRELDPWQTVKIGDVEMTALPFHGEQDEPGAHIDHFTYVFRMPGLTVYGGVDAYRDTHGEMLPVLEQVRRDWAPDVAFVPISRMTYRWRHGGVNGFCRYVDTSLLDSSFQYTAGAEDVIEWLRALGVERVVPYAMFNFTPRQIPPQLREFDTTLSAAGLGDLLLALRPFDLVRADDLRGWRASARRRYLRTSLRGHTAARHIDRRLSAHGTYRAVKRIVHPGAGRAAARHH